MAKLEELNVGCTVEGILPREAVTIVASPWHSADCREIIYRTAQGQMESRTVFREEESLLTVAEKSLPWSFDAPGDRLKLVSEANRIRLAYLFDPYLAVHTSSVDPLPHQISAVYEEMLPRLPLRYVLADDPGAGKTIMTGLLIRELIIRGDLRRCLIVAPGNLCEQWQDEMYSRFHLRFDILTNDLMESSVTGNIFAERNFCIARLDKLSRNQALQEKLRVTDWDLIVCDEAHKMAASMWGGEIRYTKRYLLGKLLGAITRHFLLLTATPHNGKEADFQLFMALIDPDRFEGALRTSHQSIDVSDVMRRLVKEDLLKFDGRPLFPERVAYTVNYSLSDREARLYSAVTSYVREEFNRADHLDGKQKSTVGFALTILQRRLASSPEAIWQSLKRRRERLESRLREEKLGQRAAQIELLEEPDEMEDLPGEELEQEEERIADQASASRTIEELEAEIATLRRLEGMADGVRRSNEDRKWDELSSLLQENEKMFDRGGVREKLIIFTEHRDTLSYLQKKIATLLGRPESVVTIHGGMLRDERHKVETLFRQDRDVRILIATDAAGEGINLQRAHLMVNYDLPWNPNRLEQRFGRIHRIGQTEVCTLWNLVARETREGEVFETLFRKLEEEKAALSGRVFDILGKVTFDDKPLRELLIEAVRYGNDPATRQRMQRIVDRALDRKHLTELLRERALTADFMDAHRVAEIREDMERMEAHKLQPHFVEAFFIEAFRELGGTIRRREEGRFEILNVPYRIRARDRLTGHGAPVATRYERVCFDRKYVNVPGLPTADQICPGQPLLDAVIDLVLEKGSDILKRGSVLIDENDPGETPRLLFSVENAIQDAHRVESGGQRVVSREVHFIGIDASGEAGRAGFAPYLDYRSATEEEQVLALSRMREENWFSGDIEGRARSYAIANLVPEHLSRVRAQRTAAANKVANAVKTRLTSEIQYWDYRASELKKKEEAGKGDHRLTAENARRRADDLTERLYRRLAELDEEKTVSARPPVVTGGALIIPQGLLLRMTGKQEIRDRLFARDRTAVELAAMRAVLRKEESLGYAARDVSAAKVGYDIESVIPEGLRNGGSSLRFIEVKGRAKGATTVTVTKNEILTALNAPENFILALVEVDGEETNTVYIRRPFTKEPDTGACSVNYKIEQLLRCGQVDGRKED